MFTQNPNALYKSIVSIIILEILSYFLYSYAIFSLGDLHGTSSSSSSSLSSPSSSGCGTDMFNDEPVMVSATGNILGRRLPEQ